MTLGRIGTHDEDTVTVSDIDPVIGHCAASERLCQSRNSGAVSDTGLVFDIDQTQGPHHGLQEPAFLIVKGGTSHTGKAGGAVDHLTFRILFRERSITGLLDAMGDFPESIFP